MQGLAIFLGLAATLCFYLAAPNQVVVRIPPGHDRLPMSTLLVWAAWLMIAASAWLWSVSYNWPVSIAATLLVVSSGLSLWPFVGSYVKSRQQRNTSGARA